MPGEEAKGQESHIKKRFCNKCLFWERNEKGDSGQCHRYAPRPICYDSKRTVLPTWATTSPDDFCGDYQAIPSGAGVW